MDMDSPATPSALSISTPLIKRPPTAKNTAYDAQHCIIRTDLSANAPATKAAHQAAYIRSFKLPVPKAAIAPKIAQAFSELGLSHSRLVMPTRENCAQFEALLEATTALVETKRVVDKVEYDIQVLKGQLGMRTSQPADGEDGGADEDAGGGDSKTNGDSMDLDDAPENEDERAQSVVSTRSGRSRKHSRRSMSMSSVDTTNTSVSTRAGMKRQKHS